MPEVYREPNQAAVAGAPPEVHQGGPYPGTAPVVVAPSLSMKPADYKVALTKQRDDELAAEEKEMTERQQHEKEFMERRHESEKKLFASKKESAKEQADAICQNAEMWQRHQEELQHVPESEREQLRARQDEERMDLEKKTGWEVHRPLVGDSTIAGFPRPLVKGHPWIRRSGLDVSRLHPSR